MYVIEKTNRQTNNEADELISRIVSIPWTHLKDRPARPVAQFFGQDRSSELLETPFILSSRYNAREAEGIETGKFALIQVWLNFSGTRNTKRVRWGSKFILKFPLGREKLWLVHEKLEEKGRGLMWHIEFKCDTWTYKGEKGRGRKHHRHFSSEKIVKFKMEDPRWCLDDVVWRQMTPLRTQHIKPWAICWLYV